MSEASYQILVNGKLVEGVSEAQAKQNMAALFKAPVEKIEPMFSGRTLAVKKGLTKEAALKYKAAINKAGMLAAVAPMETSEAAPAAEARASDTDLSHATIAPVGSTVDETPPPAEPDIDTSGLVMGMTGIDLDDSPPVPEPQIDTSELSAAQVGSDVTDYTPIPEPEIDISQLSAAEVGSDVTDTVAVPPADIDTSGLSMGGVGEDVMEHPEVPPANIDTSQLSLDEESKES